MSDYSDHIGPGAVLGNYRIEQLLGRGGMGQVFLAHDSMLHRPVALKLLAADYESKEARAVLVREARNAAALNHPNICTIHEVNSSEATAFIAMEYVAGRSLREHVDAGPLPLDKLILYGVQAADALAYAHDHGVIHRDFKAANVIVSDDAQRLKVVDFGLARRSDALISDATTIKSLTPAGALAGTPYAMAPEQVRGDRTDARTDIWALGVLLYEMANGGKPFEAPTTPELFSAILRDPPQPYRDHVPVEIRRIVDRCLAKDPQARYQHAKEVRAALEVATATKAPLIVWPRVDRRLLLWAAVLIFTLTVGVFAGIMFRNRVAPGSRNGAIRIAVLPFENLIGDPNQAFIADGLTDEMITKLGQLHPSRLSVIARTSSMRYKNRSTPIDQIGRELNVAYLLEGSTRRDGDRVRVSATLIDVRDQSQRWGGTFEREFAGILSLESDIAFNVAKALALALLPAEQARLAGAPLVNPEAYEAYLRGVKEQSTLNAASVSAAEHFFNTALDKDPTYALTYVGIAGVWIARQQTGVAPRSETAPKIRAAIQKALELDDTLADAHYRLAELNAWTDWDWPAAGREFERAIDLNPSQAATRSLYADYLVIQNRPTEALAQIQRAADLDPLNPQTRAFLGRVLMFTRQYEQSYVQYQAALKMAPNQQVAIANLRMLLHEMGKFQDALAADRTWAKTAARGGDELLDALARGYAEDGYRGAMRRAAEVQERRASTTGSIAFMAAQFYMRAGDSESALKWLERSFELHDPGLPYIQVTSVWDPLRSNPRFQALLRKMNL